MGYREDGRRMNKVVLDNIALDNKSVNIRISSVNIGNSFGPSITLGAKETVKFTAHGYPYTLALLRIEPGQAIFQLRRYEN